MNRRELVLNKLQEIPEPEVIEVIKQLTHHVQARLRYKSMWDRRKFGAHSANNLGMEAIDFYVGESFKRLYDPNGWDWKFETYTLAEQLMRIANKLISDNVEEYKKKRINAPIFDDRDISDINDLNLSNMMDLDENEEMYEEMIELAYKLSQDDDNLHYFTIQYFERVKLDKIAEEMGLKIEQIYALRKKLVRRLTSYKDQLTTNN